MASSKILTRDRAELLVGAMKDAGGVTASWQEVRSPSSRVVVRRRLMIAVAVDEDPPGEGDLIVVGEWKSEAQVEIRLALQDVHKELNLARLCLTPRHGHVIHWHLYEDARGPTEVKDVSHQPATLDHVTMLNELFIPTMRITNIAESLLP